MKLKTAQRLYMKQIDTRRRKIVALRNQGFTWAAIGKLMGITHQRAQQIGSKKLG